MARMFVSPMGDPTYANAAASLAEALFPNAKAQAAARMAGAQYRGQLLGNEQTELENIGLRRSNTAYESFDSVFDDPALVALLRAGGGNADQLAAAVGKRQEQGFRGNAVERAASGDWTGANAQLVGVANGPVRVNDIDSGYQLNPYDQGAPIVATGETLADIALAAARAGQADAAAGANRALEERRRDEIANPDRYRSDGGAGGKPLPAGDSRLLTSEILARIPTGVGYSEADLAAAVGRAEQLRAGGMPIGTAAATAFDEIFGLDAKPVTPTKTAGLSDGLIDWLTGAQVPTGEPARLERRPAPAPAVPAAPAAPVRARNPNTGEVVELRNGQWVPVQ